MSDFWDSLLRLEGFWNSPLRVEILRVVATGAFFILGVVAGLLWAMWSRYRQKKTAEHGECRKTSSRSRKSWSIDATTARK